MKKQIKRSISLLLIICMVLCNILPSLASENVEAEKITESKIVEQLKEDLGEEKAYEILASSEFEYEQKVKDENVIVNEEEITKNDERDECEEGNEVKEEPKVNEEVVANDEKNVESENDGETELEFEDEIIDDEESITPTCDDEEFIDENLIEEPEEDVINEEKNDEETESEDGELQNDEEVESEDNTSQNDEEVENEDDELENNEEIENENDELKNEVDDVEEVVEEEFIENIATDSEIEECEKKINDVNVDNEQLDEETFDDIATDSEIDGIIKIENNIKLFGVPENNIYWYIDGNTLHLSGMEPTNANYVSGQVFDRITLGTDAPWYSQRLSITDVTIDNNISPTTCQYLFANLENITSINYLTRIDTSNVTNMGNMFHGCASLTAIDVSNFDTSNVEVMSSMFSCYKIADYHIISALTNIIGLNNFNTSNVTSMDGMFEGCKNLTSIDVSNFDTLNVTRMDRMFSDCSSIISLNVSNFNTSNIGPSTGVYCHCNGHPAEGISCMFEGCSGLTSLDISNFDISNVTSICNLFKGCSSLSYINFGTFNTSKVEYMEYLFSECSSLINLNLSNFDTSNVVNMKCMFYECSSLETLNVSSFDTSNVTGMDWMFCNCSLLTSLDLSSFDTSMLTDMSLMFNGCSSLETLNVSNFNTSNVTDMSSMFSNCSSLTSLDLSSFDTSMVTNMHSMFSNSGVISLDLSSFDTSMLTDMSYMFSGCSNLTEIDVTDTFNVSNVSNYSDMFYYCINLIGGNGTTYDDSHIDKEYARIDGAGGLPGYFTEGTTSTEEYTVSFDMQGHGTQVSSQTIQHNHKVTIPASPSCTGYTFSGWYKESSCSNQWNFDVNRVTSDMTLYAKWTINTYTLTFDLSGVTATAPSNVTKTYGTNVTLPSPTGLPSGYTFVGWYKENSLTNQYTGNDDLSSTQGDTVTVYAKWKARVTYNTNGRGTVSPTYVDVVLNEIIPSAPSMSSVVGYTFNGWYKESGCTNEWNMGSDVVDEPKVLYAKWTIDTYNVTLNTNGGTINSGNITTYTYGVETTLPTDITKVNNIFKGWYDNSGFTGSPITSIANNATGDKEYFAKWNPSFTVTFDVVNGKNTNEGDYRAPAGTVAPPSQNIENGYKSTRPTDPTASNSQFLGWYRDINCTNAWNFNTDTITSDTTIYAKWHAVQTYTFNFDANGHGTAPATQYVVEDTKVTNPGSLTSEGYTFVRWYETDENVAFNFNTVIPAGSPNTPRTLYAKWQENTYSITYNTNGGSYIGGYTPTATRLYTQAVILPIGTDIEKHAFTLDGWYEDSSFGVEATSPYGANIASNKTLYAKWTQAVGSHIITFNANGGSGNMPTQGALDGETITLMSNTFTRSGYNFSRWVDTNGVSYTNGATIENVTTDLVLNAQWTVVPSGNNNGGSHGGGGGGGGGGSKTNGAQGLNPFTIGSGTTNTQATAKISSPRIVGTEKTANSATSEWVKNADGSWGLNLNGITINNGFLIMTTMDAATALITNNIYHFDETGKMTVGWLKDTNGTFYFFEDAKTANEGKMCFGWKQMSTGVWYYFGTDGKMLAGQMTPDGYMLNADGSWVNPNVDSNIQTTYINTNSGITESFGSNGRTESNIEMKGPALNN